MVKNNWWSREGTVTALSVAWSLKAAHVGFSRCQSTVIYYGVHNSTKIGTNLPILHVYGTMENKIVTVICRAQTLRKYGIKKLKSPISKKFYVQCFAFANPIKSYRINESSNTKIYWSSCEKVSFKV